MTAIKAHTPPSPELVRMDERYVSYAEQNVPRYTSYPTAPHFTPAVTGALYAEWIAEIPAKGAPVSLYLHVPFCREICWYCGCNTKAARRREPIEQYVATLRAEIALVAAISGRSPVNRIHWGGGTPNILAPDDFEAVLDSLGAAFDLAGVVEHAIEIDPRTLTKAQVDTYARYGVTRASLGVQDFNPHVQQAIGRIQPAETVADATYLLKASGISGISFDLMYGLPHQTVDDARNSAVIALAMKPDRISVFGYAHVPWFKTRQRLIDGDSLPSLHQRSAQVDAVAEVMGEYGYVEIGLDHYARADDPLARAARTGTLRRNFQGYVDDTCEALIGVGASAISNLPQGYAQNSPEVGQWGRAVNAGTLPTVRGYALNEDDRVRKAIIERLLCDFEVDLASLGGISRFDEARSALVQAEKDGLVIFHGDSVQIPHHARRLARVVASAFDTFLASRPARHSRAV